MGLAIPKLHKFILIFILSIEFQYFSTLKIIFDNIGKKTICRASFLFPSLRTFIRSISIFEV